MSNYFTNSRSLIKETHSNFSFYLRPNIYCAIFNYLLIISELKAHKILVSKQSQPLRLLIIFRNRKTYLPYIINKYLIKNAKKYMRFKIPKSLDLKLFS